METIFGVADNKQMFRCLSSFLKNGVHERTRTSDPRIHTTSTFAAAIDVRGLDCPFTMGLSL